ncbi:MAG TPA: DUF4332 domain-containing protein [Candidatus Kapabacteria bacterium]|nr:DUF4332 domain-containing protein [Candidatus Kapabacteria bacterium]HPO62149.1 DUF4332 domain-containing protein [Candidatus Kapabacteria bacterium]
MGYYIDLEKITLDEYKAKLEVGYLPPSRMILKENLNERFDILKQRGVNNLKDLQQILKQKNNLTEFSKIEYFSEEYLSILLREINSMHPKPNKIKDFIGISNQTINKLEKIGIKDTVKLFDRVKNSQKRHELANYLDIPEDEILILTKLIDLSRIKWVGATFARMLLEVGCDSVQKAANSNPEDLYKKINQINKEKNFFKGGIGLNDMRIFVFAAKEVPIEIEY